LAGEAAQQQVKAEHFFPHKHRAGAALQAGTA
jgi:hypothetical protein